MKTVFKVIVLVVATFGFVQTASAASENDHQVTICHATGNEGHYSMPSPTKQQISEANGHNNGNEESVHVGDIIPPFDAGEHGGQSWEAFPGQNWDETGQAIFNNGCVVPVVETTTTTVLETTTTTAVELIPPIVVEQSVGVPVPVSEAQLPRTGVSEYAHLITFAGGLLLSGLGFMLLRPQR